MPKEWAIVTGASGGLGEALARNLAERGYHLVLVARGEAALQALAAELRGRHGIEILVQALDMAVAGSAAVLYARLVDAGIEPSLLVNNAAFGMTGAFVEGDAERLRAMLQLNIVSLSEITLLVGRAMKARGAGRILLVGSVAGFQPTPGLAAYGATKAFVLSLGESLHVELAPQVNVTVLSPGLMDTGFNAASGFETPANLRWTILSTATVAQIGLDALFAGRSGIVAGRFNALMAFTSRLFSRHFAAKASYRMGQQQHGG